MKYLGLILLIAAAQADDDFLSLVEAQAHEFELVAQNQWQQHQKKHRDLLHEISWRDPATYEIFLSLSPRQKVEVVRAIRLAGYQPHQSYEIKQLILQHKNMQVHIRQQRIADAY